MITKRVMSVVLPSLPSSRPSFPSPSGTSSTSTTIGPTTVRSAACVPATTSHATHTGTMSSSPGSRSQLSMVPSMVPCSFFLASACQRSWVTLQLASCRLSTLTCTFQHKCTALTRSGRALCQMDRPLRTPTGCTLSPPSRSP